MIRVKLEKFELTTDERGYSRESSLMTIGELVIDADTENPSKLAAFVQLAIEGAVFTVSKDVA